MKKSIILFCLFLTTIFTGQLMAQEEEPIQMNECSAKLTTAYARVLTNPSSKFNLRLKELKKLPIDQVLKAQSFKKINGKFKLNIQKSANGPGGGDGPDGGDAFSGNTRVVPIVAHIVRRSNSSGGLSRADLNASVARANNMYRSVNLQFQVCQVKYINNNALYSHRYMYDDDKNNTSNGAYRKLGMSSRSVARKLNIYFVQSSQTSWSNFPSRSARKQHIIMRNDHTRNESTLGHEIGHWFSLLHTHETYRGAELVNGSNCSSSGDFVCDTAADPGSGFRSNCTYGGSSRDANGQRYNPDPRNVMSYASKPCRNRFSNGQIYSMQSAYLGMDDDRGYTFNACSGGNSSMSVGGYYSCNDGGHYYIRQVGNNVYWFGEHPNGRWANVYKGTINSSGTIRGSFHDVPKGGMAGRGSLSVRVTNGGNTITKVGTSPFGGTRWTKRNRPSRLPGARAAGFNTNGNMNDLDGKWSCNDGGQYYVREIGGLVVWFGEGRLNSRGIPGFANVAVGRRSGNTVNLDWADVAKCTMEGKGTLTLRVNNANEFVRTARTGGFGGSKWTRARGVPSILGRWINTDKKTKGITKFIVSNKSKTIHLYGSCSPKDCDWGKTTVKKSGSSYKAYYSNSHKRNITLSSVSGGRIKMVMKSTPKRGGKARTETYYFKKQATINNATLKTKSPIKPRIKLGKN